jgi:dipicolinate synthase subunit A
MKKQTVAAVLGGDLRHAHLANSMAEKTPDYKVYGLFFDQDVKLSHHVHKGSDVRLVLPQSDIVILPLPALDASGHINTPLSGASISYQDCFDYILPETVILAGRATEEMCLAAMERGLTLIDYMEREEFAVLNAVPTAEGAIEIALRELPFTLYQSTCMVVGYGRIARVLTKLLLAFGADVRVVARRHSDLAWIGIAGAAPVHLSSLEDHLREVDVLFNTVPAMILTEEKLEKLGRHSLVIDLASKPGGVDFETAKRLGLKTIWALSLPGKVAPITAGEIILRTVRNILAERG